MAGTVLCDEREITRRCPPRSTCVQHVKARANSEPIVLHVHKPSRRISTEPKRKSDTPQCHRVDVHLSEPPLREFERSLVQRRIQKADEKFGKLKSLLSTASDKIGPDDSGDHSAPEEDANGDHYTDIVYTRSLQPGTGDFSDDVFITLERSGAKDVICDLGSNDEKESGDSDTDVVCEEKDFLQSSDLFEAEAEVLDIEGLPVFGSQVLELPGSLQAVFDFTEKVPGKMFPRSFASKMKGICPNLKKRLRDFLDQKGGGFVFLSRCLSVSLNLEKVPTQPENVICDALVLTQKDPPYLLTCCKERGETESLRSYNADLAKRLLKLLRKFSSVDFTILYGVMTKDHYDDKESFTQELDKIWKRVLKWSLITNMIMNEEKYLNVKESLLIASARTKRPERKPEMGEDAVWILTRDQYPVVTENIDEDTVEIKAEPSSGCTVLALEVAERLHRNGRTALVSYDERLRDVVRGHAEDVDVLTLREFQTMPEDSRYQHVVMMVNTSDTQALAAVEHIPGRKWLLHKLTTSKGENSTDSSKS